MDTYNKFKKAYYEVLAENNTLKKNIHSLRDLLSSDICKYFELTNSINDTKKRFMYDNFYDCYIDLCYYFGSANTVRNADDFKECYKAIFDREYPENIRTDVIEDDK
jgi:hypothetical protein